MTVDMYLVTVKLPRNPDHDPHAKVTGECPVSPGTVCTDVTGEHHTILVVGKNGLATARAAWSHITRVEQVNPEPANREGMPKRRYRPDLPPAFARHHEDGHWVVVGPASVVVEGVELRIVRFDREPAAFVRVGAIVAEMTVNHRDAGPIRYVTAEFTNSRLK